MTGTLRENNRLRRWEAAVSYTHLDVYKRQALAGAEFCHVQELHLGRGRAMVRSRASLHALDLVRRYLTGRPWAE